MFVIYDLVAKREVSNPIATIDEAADICRIVSKITSRIYVIKVI